MTEPTQPYLPGIEPAYVGDQATTEAMPKSAVMVIRDGAPAEVFPDMKALKEADLVAGEYEVWRYGGQFTVEEVPARVRTSFKSAISRPHKTDKPAKTPPKRRHSKGDTNGSAA